jgi:hypothetical protein
MSYQVSYIIKLDNLKQERRIPQISVKSWCDRQPDPSISGFIRITRQTKQFDIIFEEEFGGTR